MISEFEENAISLGLNSPVYTAAFDDSGTKVYSDTDLKLHWNAGDEISIFSTTGNQRYSFDGQTGDREGTFSVQGDPVGGSALANTVAVFPYASETTVSSDGIISLNLPSVQGYAENSFGMADNTMVAVAENKDSDKLYFKNLCGYIVVRLYGEGVVKSIALTGNNEEKLSGQATVTASFGEAPVLTMSESAGTSISLDCGEGVPLGASAEDATEFWFVVPPVKFTHGFSVTVTDVNLSTLTKRMGVERTVQRNVKTSLAPVKVSPLTITFDSSDLVVMPVNATRDIHYSIVSESDDITIEAHASGKVEAEVVNTNARTGSIKVKTGDVINEACKVVVLVSNGSQAIMRTLNFEEEAIEVEENTTKEVTDEGGEVTLEFFSNVSCHAVIPEEAQSWISVAPETKSMEKQSIGLILQPNTGAARSATVNVMSEDGTLLLPYLIDQGPNHDYQLAIEREALIAIYNALDGDHWENNTNWCSDKPVWEWYGVVTGDNHYVNHLNLIQNSKPMKGQIPSEIGKLIHLKSINFWLETNMGLPEEIGHLKEMEQFTLWFFDTSEETQFPEGLYDCTGLKILNLTGAGIGGTISPKIGQLKNLERLELGSNNISGPLPDEIGELSNLEILNIRGSKEIGQIPSSIGNLKKLKSIHLTHMSGAIPKEIGDIPGLEEIHFYSEYPITSIPDEIYNIKTLTFLELSFTQCPYSIPETIGNLTELEFLTINYDLTGVIPASIGNLKKLKYLNLSNPYSMGNESLSGEIPESIQQLEYWPYFWADVISGHPKLNTNNLALPAPHIQAKDLDGVIIDTDVIYSSNRLTIIYSWDEVCPAVQYLHPILKEAFAKYNDAGLEIIGYNGGQYEDYIQTLVERFDVPWRNFSGPHYPFANGQTMCPGFITGLALAIDSSGTIVYNTLTGSFKGLEDYIETVFGNPDWYISSDYSADGTATTLQQSTAGSGIDLILMGDAFSDRQIADGTYGNVMLKAMNGFFSEEPYKSMKDRFNVYTVNVVSATEGYEHAEQALSTGHGDGTYVYGNDSKVIEYAKKAVGEDSLDDALIIVMMNEDACAGTCFMYNPPSGNYGRGLSIAYFPTSSDTDTFNGLVSHEAGGHGFAKLADEYAYESMGAISADAIASTKVNEPYGWWKNVDFTSDPAQVKWSQFLSDPRYANEGLGCYEGGLTYWTGVWRPTENSIMRYNTGGFNAPSRYAIWYRIGKLAYGQSWEGSYEDFVAYDQVNRTPAAVQRRHEQARRQRLSKPMPPLAPPVVINHSWREELSKAK